MTVDDNDPRLYRKVIDTRVKLLVGVLNTLPNVHTYVSCGGHKKTDGRLNPVRYGEFYVGFTIRSDVPEESINATISIIKKAIEFFDGDITIEEEASKLNTRFWEIYGKKIHPDDLAVQIIRFYKQ